MVSSFNRCHIPFNTADMLILIYIVLQWEISAISAKTNIGISAYQHILSAYVFFKNHVDISSGYMPKDHGHQQSQWTLHVYQLSEHRGVYMEETYISAQFPVSICLLPFCCMW